MCGTWIMMGILVQLEKRLLLTRGSKLRAKNWSAPSETKTTWSRVLQYLQKGPANPISKPGPESEGCFSPVATCETAKAG